MRKVLQIVSLLILFCIIARPGFSQNTSGANPQPAPVSTEDLTNASFLNPSLPIEVRVNDLVSRMTLEEKVSQMAHSAAAIPRLGIPQYNWWSEGLHGAARQGVATVFPQAIGLAATFDPALLHQVGDVAATEFRAKYHEELRQKGYSTWFHGLTVWSPNINIFRDPRWGRGQETYGEDPFLTAQMGVAFVTGLQGDNPKYLKTLATSKHFAVHSGPESQRHTMNVNASPHDLEDTYLPAFRATVQAGAGSVMCAYNSVDGKPACAQPLLLQEHLRDAWGFKGYVVSDCGAVSDVFNGHHYTKNIEEGVAAALKAGTDLTCGLPMDNVTYERDALLHAAQQGLITQEDIDRAVLRLFTARMRLGMFDPPAMVPYASIPMSENDSELHRQLALRVARESLVLLKNSEQLLPLAKKYKTIAVIGPNADNLDALVGNYNGTPSHPVTILAGIKKRFPGSHIIYAEGTGLTGPSLTVIPSNFLRSGPNYSQDGLAGEYFKGTDLRNPVVIARTDSQIDFTWDDGASKELLNNFSVRWTGALVPPATGDYEIGFTGDDGYRLWVDNKVIAEDWSNHSASTNSQTLRLIAGQKYPIRIEYFQGTGGATARLIWHRPGGHAEAMDAARKADLIVAVFGLTANLEGEEMNINAEGFNGGDRTSLDLPKPQAQLLEQIAATGKPLVLVLMNGSAIAANWADQHVRGILEAWYPGEEGGTAVAEALAGDFSPGGRLPVTFYKAVEQLPPFDDYSLKGRTYRYFAGEPLYPFGYGLSYGKFAYSHLDFDKKQVSATESITISSDVTNSGTVAADEVVQVYLSHRDAAGAPIRSLAGFQRIHLGPGETQTVHIPVANRQLSIVNQVGERQVLSGMVDVWVGGGQPVHRTGLADAEGLSGSFEISGEATLPK